MTIAFADRGLGLHALLLLGVSIILVQPALFSNHTDLKPWLLLIALMLIIGTIAPLLLVWDRTNGLMMRLCGRIIGGADAWHEAMKLYRQQPGMLCGAYFFSVGSAIFNILAIHLMMLAVGSSLTIVESLAVAPVVILANTIPFTPGGVGVAERAKRWTLCFSGSRRRCEWYASEKVFYCPSRLVGTSIFASQEARDALQKRFTPDKHDTKGF